MRVPLANALWVLGCLPAAASFRRACRRVQEVQSHLLLELVRRSKDTAFGREHDFAGIVSAVDFQRRVPLADYENYAPYIERIAYGEAGVLTADVVRLFEPTGGSTAGAKWIPYTQGLQQDFQRGIDPWIWHLFAWKPRLFLGRAYWSISPSGQEQERTAGGIPIGFEEDSAYLGPFKQRLVDSLLVVPGEVARIRDMSAFRYVTLLFLLRCRDLALISVWNPTFLTLLLAPLQKWGRDLVGNLARGRLAAKVPLEPGQRLALERYLRRQGRRAREVERILAGWQGHSPLERDARGRTLYEALWPRLAVISCWADGNAVPYARQLQGAFPHVSLQPKGLLATEGFVSFPLGGQDGAVLAVGCHFFEFVEHPAGTAVRLAHELELGRCYTVVLTTAGGLYRYRLHDLVEVVGFYGQCPRLRFVGKADQVCDLFGEKLHEGHVRAVVEGAWARHGLEVPFWLVAPAALADGVGYTLFLLPPGEAGEGLLQAIGREVEAGLRQNYHYDYCRRLRQLAGLRVFQIEASVEQVQRAYLNTCVSLGQRLGDVKPAALHHYQGWVEAFPGRFISWGTGQGLPVVL